MDLSRHFFIQTVLNRKTLLNHFSVLTAVWFLEIQKSVCLCVCFFHTAKPENSFEHSAAAMQASKLLCLKDLKTLKAPRTNQHNPLSSSQDVLI